MPLARKNCTCKMSRNLNLVKLVFRVVWQPGVVHARSEQSNLRRAISLRLLASCLSLHNGKVSWNIDFLYQWWMSCMHASCTHFLHWSSRYALSTWKLRIFDYGILRAETMPCLALCRHWVWCSTRLCTRLSWRISYFHIFSITSSSLSYSQRTTWLASRLKYIIADIAKVSSRLQHVKNKWLLTEQKSVHLCMHVAAVAARIERTRNLKSRMASAARISKYCE